MKRHSSNKASETVSLEYRIEHYGALPFDEERIRRLVGEDVLGTLDFMISKIESDQILVAISGTDRSRIAFAKTIQHMCTISDSIVVTEI